MAYAISEVNRLEETNWVYHDEPGKTIYVAGIMTIITAAVFALIYKRQDLHAALIYQLMATVLLVAAVLSLTLRSAIIEINRSEGVVSKTSRLLFFRISRAYPLPDFDTIRLLEQVKTIEEGYLSVFYTIALQGHRRSFELLSVDEAKKGAQLCKEIISFFALSGHEIVLQEVKATDRIKLDSN